MQVANNKYGGGFSSPYFFRLTIAKKYGIILISHNIKEVFKIIETITGILIIIYLILSFVTFSILINNCDDIRVYHVLLSIIFIPSAILALISGGIVYITSKIINFFKFKTKIWNFLNKKLF